MVCTISPAPESSTVATAISRQHQGLAQCRRRAGRASTRPDDELLAADAGRFDGRNDAEQERARAAEQRRPRRAPTRSRRISSRRGISRGASADESREDRRTGQRPEHTTGDDEERLFDEELADQGPPAAADRRADAELVGARGALVQQQTGEIDAGDEQKQRDGARERRSASAPCPRRRGRRAGRDARRCPCWLPVLQCQRRRDGLHFRAGGGDTDSWTSTGRRRTEFVRVLRLCIPR